MLACCSLQKSHRDSFHDRKEITGSLFEIVEQVMDFVRLYTKVAYRFTGKPQRENVYEYPLEAIRKLSSILLCIEIILSTDITIF